MPGDPSGQEGFAILTDRGQSVRMGDPGCRVKGGSVHRIRRLGLYACETARPPDRTGAPGAGQLRCGETFSKSIAGIRAEGTVSILVDGQCIASDRGEIQLTNYGISGIPVFQVSRYASRLFV